MTRRLFTFNNGVILPCAGYGAEIEPQIAYNGKICWIRLIMISITVPSFDFVFKKLMELSLTSECRVCHSRFVRWAVEFTKHFLGGNLLTNTFKLCNCNFGGNGRLHSSVPVEAA